MVKEIHGAIPSTMKKNEIIERIYLNALDCWLIEKLQFLINF